MSVKALSAVFDYFCKLGLHFHILWHTISHLPIACLYKSFCIGVLFRCHSFEVHRSTGPESFKVMLTTIGIRP
eukprot:3908194-Pyramimonas_sp.AAC.1